MLFTGNTVYFPTTWCVYHVTVEKMRISQDLDSDLVRKVMGIYHLLLDIESWCVCVFLDEIIQLCG